MVIEAVIFDMDGVIIDSEPFWEAAEMEIFGELGLKLSKEMCYQTVGLRTDEVVKYWYDQYPWNGLSKKEVEIAITKKVRDQILENGKAMKGLENAIEMIQHLKLKLSLASSSAMEIIETVLNKLDIRSKFEVVHSAELEEFGKPHPAVYISTARKMGIDPKNCLAIEDSFNGLISAKAARMKTIAIPESSMSGHPKFSIADLKLNSLSEFNEHILHDLNSNKPRNTG
ncbi:hexitol phosphatase HxpB [Fulvivirgaceae bacterium BMA10]|uniref:Hexitol phosphatase HxpB n=1 Tax=Splendidivirga corallicola TaxID=3051826 RepID=A0ABT8KRR8_9BACT|nr:hexitol phosphatase HxpB [Fulvivirgaceae bacterium BMA10]